MFDPTFIVPRPRDSDGAYLIECNPQIFAAILDMLRKDNYEICSLKILLLVSALLELF